MSITWDQVRGIMNEAATKAGEWAGAPLPIDELHLVIEPRYPYKLNGVRLGANGLDRRPESPVENLTLINQWFCLRRGATIYLYREDDGRVRFLAWPEYGAPKLDHWLRTLGASLAWGEETETKALEKLKQLVTPHAYKCYVLTGSFLETSKRSGVRYFFRKLRPTIAITGREDQHLRILATLCMHPIGYYEKSWAGVMCPTDDVIAHLLMMRGDEAKFWAKANHHPVYRAEAGL